MQPNTFQQFFQQKGLLVAAGLLASCAFAAVTGRQGWLALFEKQEQIRQLQDANDQLAADNARKQSRLDRLRTSRSEQENEIHRIKKVKPNETIFMLHGSEDPSTQSR